MKNNGQEPMRYTIEREFSAKASVTELINRIIQNHIKALQEKEDIAL